MIEEFKDGVLHSIHIKTHRGDINIDIDNVPFFKTDAGYISVTIDDKSYLIDTSLRKLWGKLPDSFMYIHRNCIINKNYVVGRKKKQIVMKSGIHLDISRREQPTCKRIFEVVA